MLVMKVDKELSTKECIEYAEQLSKHLGEKVVILDKKVISFERLEEPKLQLFPEYPNTTPYYDEFYYTITSMK